MAYVSPRICRSSPLGLGTTGQLSAGRQSTPAPSFRLPPCALGGFRFTRAARSTNSAALVLTASQPSSPVSVERNSSHACQKCHRSHRT